MSSPSSAAGRVAPAALRLGQALALGALHGPAELLADLLLGPRRARARGCCAGTTIELDDELRKSFEVALHAGTAAALLITLRDEVGEAVRGLNARRLALIALSFAPPAVVGYTLERPIERHFGTPPTIAAALLAGAIVMALADRAPQDRAGTRRRARAMRCGSGSPRRAR